MKLQRFQYELADIHDDTSDFRQRDLSIKDGVVFFTIDRE